MTEEIKKLIESVKVYQHPVPLCFDSIARALVDKSDFDKVVKELEYLSELRKPSEDIKQAIEEFANSQYNKDATLICANSLRESIESYEDGKRDGIIIGAEFALNLSENSVQVDEDLKSKVRNIFENIFNKYCMEIKDCDGFPIGSICTNDVAFYDMEQELCNKIAALILSSRSHKNGAELLEAAKYFRDAWYCDFSKLTALINDVNRHNKAISNYEKQSK